MAIFSMNFHTVSRQPKMRSSHSRDREKANFFPDEGGQEKAGKLADSQQNKSEEEEQTKRSKRPRKTIEQEIAELDAKRQRLMEKKRRQEAHEKIVFGATVIAMLKNMKENNNTNFNIFCKGIMTYIKSINLKDEDIIKNIINKI